MEILGSSGEGKSKFMEHMIRRDIINNNGLCLIDPHGYLYNDLVRWCETKRFLDPERLKLKKIILFDPSTDGWTFGFNPLKPATADISFHVDAMVKAVSKVWGGEDPAKTPLLKRCLRVLFHLLAETDSTLYEAQHLINPADEAIRTYLAKDLKDPIIKQQWDYFNQLNPRQFYEDFGSTINRMMEFLSSPIIRSIIGQQDQTIEFRDIMDDGWMLLVNLSSGAKISDDNARLLGTLIVNELFMKAKARPEGSRPFYLYIDECARFINEDIGRILDEGRKFGLHLILAHQHLAQLKKAGEEVYQAVMTDAKTKVIFGGLNTEDARVMAEQVFLGELNLEDPKNILNRPVVVGYAKEWLENFSFGRSYGESHSEAKQRGEGSTTGGSAGQMFIPQGLLEADLLVSSSTVELNTSSSLKTEAEAKTLSEAHSETSGRSEALMPILEERITAVKDLSEKIYEAMAILVNQPRQRAVVKLPKKKTKIITTPTIEPGFANDKRVQRFKEQCYNDAEFAHDQKEIVRQIKKRTARLQAEARKYQEELRKAREKKDPETFRG
jgi:hypothetical protein